MNRRGFLQSLAALPVAAAAGAAALAIDPLDAPLQWVPFKPAPAAVLDVEKIMTAKKVLMRNERVNREMSAHFRAYQAEVMDAYTQRIDRDILAKLLKV